MALARFWCGTCADVRQGTDAASCGAHGHDLRKIGVECSVLVCVTDRRHQLDVQKYGFQNNVGHAHGRSIAEQERHTRAQIEDMRKQAAERKRQRRISVGTRDNPYVSGAIPSALLFSLRKQYGHDYLQHAKELMKRENLWFGEE